MVIFKKKKDFDIGSIYLGTLFVIKVILHSGWKNSVHIHIYTFFFFTKVKGK